MAETLCQVAVRRKKVSGIDDLSLSLSLHCFCSPSVRLIAHLRNPCLAEGSQCRLPDLRPDFLHPTPFCPSWLQAAGLAWQSRPGIAKCLTNSWGPVGLLAKLKGPGEAVSVHKSHTGWVGLEMDSGLANSNCNYTLLTPRVLDGRHEKKHVANPLTAS